MITVAFAPDPPRQPDPLAGLYIQYRHYIAMRDLAPTLPTEYRRLPATVHIETVGAFEPRIGRQLTTFDIEIDYRDVDGRHVIAHGHVVGRVTGGGGVRWIKSELMPQLADDHTNGRAFTLRILRCNVPLNFRGKEYEYVPAIMKVTAA